MADYTSRTVVTTVREYALPSPTNWAEVQKVFAAIKNELSSQSLSDDTVTVRAHEDEIVFSYLVESRNA
jgi:hypothetical protein